MLRVLSIAAVAAAPTMIGCHDDGAPPTTPTSAGADASPDPRPRSCAGPRMGSGPAPDPTGPPEMYGAPACVNESTPLSSEARAAIERAVTAERTAEVRYATASRHLATPGPFARVAVSQRHHAPRLESLLASRGVVIPPFHAPKIEKPETLAAACRDGVASEKATIALYDELSKVLVPADVRCVFDHLRFASAERHLPAFERCSLH